MKKIAVILAFIFSLCIAASAQADWVGVYEFGEDGGKTAGGSAIFISHQIDVRKTDDGYLATIVSNGYQTSREIVASVKANGARLEFYFESYGENNSLETYAEGDLLLTLERKTEKKKTEILTYWGKFKPVIDANAKDGKVYFQKIAVKYDGS